MRRANIGFDPLCDGGQRENRAVVPARPYQVQSDADGCRKFGVYTSEAAPFSAQAGGGELCSDSARYARLKQFICQSNLLRG